TVYPQNGGVQAQNGGVLTCRFPVILKPDPANAASVHIQFFNSQGSFSSPSSQSNDGPLTSPPPTDGSECSTIKQGRASVKSDTSQSISESNMSVSQEGDAAPGAQRQVSVDGPPSRLYSLQYPCDEFSFNSGLNLESRNHYMEPQSSQGHYQRAQNGHHMRFQGQQQMNQDCAQGQFFETLSGQGQHIIGQGSNMESHIGQYIGTQDQRLGPTGPNGLINMQPLHQHHPRNGASNYRPPSTLIPQNVQAYLNGPTQKLGPDNGSLAHHQQQIGQPDLMGRFLVNEQTINQISSNQVNPPVQHVNNGQPSNMYQAMSNDQSCSVARADTSRHLQQVHPCVGLHQNGSTCCSHLTESRSVKLLAGSRHAPPGVMINNFYAHGGSTQSPGAPYPVASHPNQEQFSNSAISNHSQQTNLSGYPNNVTSSARSNTASTMNPKPAINLPKEKKVCMVGKWIQNSRFTELDSGTYDPSDHSLKCGSTHPPAGGAESEPHIIYGLDGKPYELQYPTTEKPKTPRKSSNSKSSRSSRTKIPSTTKTSVSENLSTSSCSSAKGEKSCAKPEPGSGYSAGMESSQYASLNNQIQIISSKPLPRDKIRAADPEEDEKKRADLEIEKFLHEKRQQSLENKKAGVLPSDSGPTVSSLEQILNKSNVDMLSVTSSDIHISMPYTNMSLEVGSCENPQPVSKEKPTKTSEFDYSTYITPQDIKSLEEQKAQSGKTSLDNYLNGGNGQEKNNGQSNMFGQVNGGPLVQLRRDDSDTLPPGVNTTQAGKVLSDPAIGAPVNAAKNQMKAAKRRSQENEELRLRQEMHQAVQAEELFLVHDYTFPGALEVQGSTDKPAFFNPTCVISNKDHAQSHLPQSRQRGDTFQNPEAGCNTLAGIPKLPKDHQLRDWVLKHQPQFKEQSNSYQDHTEHKQHGQQFFPHPNQLPVQNKQQTQPAGQPKMPANGKPGQPLNYPQAPQQTLNRDDFKVPHSVSPMPLHSTTFPSIGGGSDVSMHSDVSSGSLTRQPGNAFGQPAGNDVLHQQMFKQRGITPPYPFQQQSDMHDFHSQQSPYFFQQRPESFAKDADLIVSSVNPCDRNMASRLQNEMPSQGLHFTFHDFHGGQGIQNNGLKPTQGHQTHLPEMLQSSSNGFYLGQGTFPVSQMANQPPSQPASKSHFTNISSPQPLSCGNSHAASSTMGPVQSSPANRGLSAAQGHQGKNGKFSADSTIGVTMGTHLYSNIMTPSCQGILGTNSQNGYQTMEPQRPSESAMTYSQTLPSILPNEISYVQGFPLSVPSTTMNPSMTNIPQNSYQDRLDSSEDMLQDLLNEGFPSLDEPPCNYDDMFLNSRGPAGDMTVSPPPVVSPKPGEPEGKKAADQGSIEKVAVSNASSMEVSKKAGDSDVSVMTISYGSSDVELPSFEPDNDGETCLHILCEMPAEHRERLATLPRFKGALNLLSRNGETALFIAVKNYKVDVVKFLLFHGADVNISCFSQEKSFRSERVQHTALHEAVEIGNQAVVEALLGAKDVHVDAKGSNGGLTPLMQALHIHKMSKRRDIIMMLIKSDASLIQQDTIQGKTALMYAIQSHDVALVEDILQMVGAEKARSLVTAMDRKGNTCLHLAAGLQQPIKTDEKQRLLRCIILAGGDPSVKNNEGESARDWDR
ncbi:unnamed protein product, partial [Lymnaea stagnalis]